MDFNAILSDIKGTQDYASSTRMLHYLANVMSKTKMKPDELKGIKAFLLDETKRLLQVIPTVPSYKQKDEIFGYEDALMHIFTVIIQSGASITDEEKDTVKSLIDLITSETVLENTVERAMQGEKVDKDEIKIVLSVVAPIKDEYQRGKIYGLLLEYKDQLKKLTPEAKALLSAHTESELERVLKLPEIDKDIENYLEFAVDVSKYYAEESLLNTIIKVLKLPYSSVRYYAADTLLSCGKEVPSEIVAALANDLCYAELTYTLLCNHKKDDLFPKELTDPVYLRKSDLVHWLIYPTELNKQPDEIEFMGTVRVKKELYYVYKYKTDSDNLEDELKNVWLIGWSTDEGGTFSNFDALAQYEKKTTEKTLKYIKKKLLK